MGRSPCCEKMGLKQGQWTAEEDQILISYISRFGHENWRALPKRAGLLRCGKSCRLRWLNYLRPDIKRGNFTREEEETIIKWHQELGNKWSVIAARLPGRTDNEIKNVWNTHLKKRLKKPEPGPKFEKDLESNSPVYSTSEFSSVSAATCNGSVSDFDVRLMADCFWPEVLPSEVWSGASYISAGNSKSLGERDHFWFDLFHRAGEFAELPEFC